MKFIKKNKFTIIAIVCFLAFMLVLIQVKNIFFPNAGKAIYGDRLDGIEEVKVSKSKLNKIVDKYTESEAVSSAKTQVSGKIINVIITIKDEVSLEDAKGLANIVLEELSTKQKKFYDIQVLIEKTNDSKQFPIVGYKHHSKETFTFTKDRAES